MLLRNTKEVQNAVQNKQAIISVAFLDKQLVFTCSKETQNKYMELINKYGYTKATAIVNNASKYNGANALNSDSTAGHVLISSGRYVDDVTGMASQLLTETDYKTEYNKVLNRYKNISIKRGKEKFTTMLGNLQGI